MTHVSKPEQKRPLTYRLWNVFKNFAIIFSFITNLVLIMIVALLLMQSDMLFTVKSEVAEPLLVDLDQAFAALGETTIKSTIYITDTMPVVFGLPLNQNTNMVLTQPVPLSVPAMFILPSGGGSINGTVSLNLPQGQILPVALGINVPVSTTIPVVMQVPVEIPLAESGMGAAIEQLRAVFRPVTGFIQSLPDSSAEILQSND